MTGVRGVDCLRKKVIENFSFFYLRFVVLVQSSSRRAWGLVSEEFCAPLSFVAWWLVNAGRVVRERRWIHPAKGNLDHRKNYLVILRDRFTKSCHIVGDQSYK